MIALYRSGRHAETLRVFDDGRHVLAEELGIDPGTELSRIYEHVLTSDSGLNLASTAAASGPAGPAADREQAGHAAASGPGITAETDAAARPRRRTTQDQTARIGWIRPAQRGHRRGRFRAAARRRCGTVMGRRIPWRSGPGATAAGRLRLLRPPRRAPHSARPAGDAMNYPAYCGPMGMSSSEIGFGLRPRLSDEISPAPLVVALVPARDCQ